MKTELFEIASHFAVEGKIETINPLGEGFINDTFFVKTENCCPDYILQRKNKNVFQNLPGLMNNIKLVTDHIKGKVSNPLRETLTIIPSTDGNLYYIDDFQEFWAMTLYIDNTISYDFADTPFLAYQGGVGLGLFQSLLSDFDKPLVEVIQGFHNIRYRFAQWDQVLLENRVKRADKLIEEIKWIEQRREEMLSFWNNVEKGIIPTHITHNDTKISNFLFDADTKEVLCAIDLDTVMNSTSLNDVGDAIRSYTNTGKEDDSNLNNVSMSINMFSQYIKGYLSQQSQHLSESEIEYLSFAGRYITFEQVLRFLMDYIDGDRYYRIKYPNHNLIRTRAQYQLLLSIELQYDSMRKVVQELTKKGVQ